MIPVWLRNQLTDQERALISEAVALAEQSTSGEIVPVIARSSIFTGHVPSMIFLIVLASCVLLDDWAQLVWSHSPAFGVFLSGVFGLLATPLARLPRVQRLFISKQDQHNQVLLRAQLEFFQAGISSTSGRTGVLLFVSMIEHEVVVLADKAIAERLPQDTWQAVVDLVITGVRRGDLSAGLRAGISRVGEILREHFPLSAHNENELSNELIIKE